MYTRKITLENASGLHARPASDFVNVAQRYTSRITIRDVNKEGASNAKSIVMLLTLGLSKGTTVEIAGEGDDEKEAVDALVELIEGHFGEEG